MPLELVVPLTAAVFLVALLYSAVGQAGASGYIAVMALFGIAPEEIRPVSLALNVLVAIIATWQFWRAGHFAWSLFWPFALASVPMAFVGGFLEVPARVFNLLVGLLLLASAAQLLVRLRAEREPDAPSVPVALGAGAGLGLLSGLTGTGGGIFLTPLLILMHWAHTSTASAVSAPFILVNSLSALSGNVTAANHLPAFIVPLVPAVVVAGYIGSRLGSRHLAHTAIRRLLALFLIVAGSKLVFT
jgi:uncharacterized membrane protein YfcA